MTPANWIALIGGGGVTLMVQAALFAFFIGKLSARMSAVESRPIASDHDCKAELAALNATLASMLGRMDTTERTIRELLLQRREHV